MNEEEKAILEDKIIECYKNKGITFDDATLYKKNQKGDIIFKESNDMPILEDLYNILGDTEKTKIFKVKLIPFIKGSLRFFNHITNVEIDNKLIIADIYDIRRRKYKIPECIYLQNYSGIE